MAEERFILAILANGQSLIASLVDRDGRWFWLNPALISVHQIPNKGEAITLAPILAWAEGPNEMLPSGGMLHVTKPNARIIEIYKKFREQTTLTSVGLVAANSLPIP